MLAKTLKKLFVSRMFQKPEETAPPSKQLRMETLTGSAVLDYDTPYSFLMQVDSESQTAVAAPEPATPLLLMADSALWLTRKRNRKDTADKRGISPN